MIVINESNKDLVLDYTNVKDKNLLSSMRAIVESEKVVLKALKSSFEVLSIFCTEEFYNSHKDLITKNTSNIYVSNKNILEEIVGFDLHHGVLCLVKIPDFTDLSNLGNKIMIFNGITSPENIGTITRASVAFGFNSIIFDAKSSSPYLRRCMRVSMGNIFEAKVHKSHGLVPTINKLKELGYEVIATANEEGAKSLLNFKYPKKICIIIGNEGNGMDREVIEACNHTLFIPIDEYVAHLNAASAASIFLYHSLI